LKKDELAEKLANQRSSKLSSVQRKKIYKSAEEKRNMLLENVTIDVPDIDMDLDIDDTMAKIDSSSTSDVSDEEEAFTFDAPSESVLMEGFDSVKLQPENNHVNDTNNNNSNINDNNNNNSNNEKSKITPQKMRNADNNNNDSKPDSNDTNPDEEVEGRKFFRAK
jgi:hypothetical protein